MTPNLLPLLSNIGILTFAGLYLYASTLYNGGTRANPHQKGWDWFHNYWCDLIWPNTYWGGKNKAAKWAITANFILCFSLILFFIAFSLTYAPGNYLPYLISISGTLAMIFVMLLFSPLHDKLIGLITLSILPAAIGTIYGLIYFNQQVALYWGLAALIITGINIFIYYTRKGDYWLPFLQKIAFVAVLSWIFYMNTTIK